MLGLIILLAWGGLPAVAQTTIRNTSTPNGVVDGLDDLALTFEVMMPMNDGTPLATDVALPILWDDLGIPQVQINLSQLVGVPLLPTLTLPTLKLANRGHQFYQYPNQPDPLRLPGVLTRTPYNKGSDAMQAQAMALLGYTGLVQDMRGRYRSAGVYLPMYSDSWAKAPYLSQIGISHPMDTTQGHEAEYHQDGWETLQHIYNQLRRTPAGDSVFISTDTQYPLVYNGSLGMFGASALANTQYQALAVGGQVHGADGVKCMLPLVGSGEFYRCTGHPNGAYRERIIDGWLRGQVEFYGQWKPDTMASNTVRDFYHTIGDYGPAIATPKEAAEQAIDYWTTMYGAHYPNSFVRGVMDISHAPLDVNGMPDPNGTVSRYTNLDVPIFNITGWWDIFTDGTIETHQFLQQYSTHNRSRQKLVIGPWAHQTIGSRATGDARIDPVTGADYRYPENVGSIIGANFDELDLQNLGDLSTSQVIDYFRNYLGQPTVVLPPLNEWQQIGNVLGNPIYIKVPADTFTTTFASFINFFMGTGPLTDLPVSIKGLNALGVDSNSVFNLTIPATGTSLIGADIGGLTVSDNVQFEWDANQPNGVPEVRFYVVGPVNDGVNGTGGRPAVGNYWYAADTFPLILPTQTLYFHANGEFNENAPDSAGSLQFLADPNNPVITHGGGNMIVRTPDGLRDSQGQMNLADPAYSAYTMNRPLQFIDGHYYTDILSFVSGEVQDSFSIAGFPVAKFWMSSHPLGNTALDSTNTDFIVRIVDVHPDGRELFVQEGVVSTMAREYAAFIADHGVENDAIGFHNIPSDSVLEYRLRLNPIAYTFGHGHRIKILISSTNYPRYQPTANLPFEAGTFLRRRPFEVKGIEYQGQTLYARRAINTMHLSDVMAASIEFPHLGPALVTARPEAQDIASLASLVHVYPNPAQSEVNVALNVPGTPTASLLDLQGRTLQSQAMPHGRCTFGVGNLPAGIYVVRVQAPDGRVVAHQKVVVQP